MREHAKINGGKINFFLLLEEKPPKLECLTIGSHCFWAITTILGKINFKKAPDQLIKQHFFRFFTHSLPPE
jgi:hypothetical protein